MIKFIQKYEPLAFFLSFISNLKKNKKVLVKKIITEAIAGHLLAMTKI